MAWGSPLSDSPVSVIPEEGRSHSLLQHGVLRSQSGEADAASARVQRAFRAAAATGTRGLVPGPSPGWGQQEPAEQRGVFAAGAPALPFTLAPCWPRLSSLAVLLSHGLPRAARPCPWSHLSLACSPLPQGVLVVRGHSMAVQRQVWVPPSSGEFPALV